MADTAQDKRLAQARERGSWFEENVALPTIDFVDRGFGQVASMSPGLYGDVAEGLALVTSPFAPEFSAELQRASDVGRNVSRELAETGLLSTILTRMQPTMPQSTTEKLNRMAPRSSYSELPQDFTRMPSVAEYAQSLKRGAESVASAPTAPASLTFGSALSALPQGTTASGNLSFSPLKVYSPEQQRIKQLAAAFAGMPTDMFQQMMSGMPERPASPSIEDMAGQDYYNLALNSYVQNMAAATSAEEQDAALQNFTDSLLTLRKTNAFLAPQVGGN